MTMTPEPAGTEKVSRYAIMVLGMHRSGTSALAGLLTQLGGDGPATPLRSSPSNQLGHFEPEALYPIQDALLASAGTTWSDYTRFPENWLTSHKADEFADRVKDLLKAEFGTSRFFVVKDPRNCRLLPFWRSLLSQENIKPLFVHMHRNPIEVAQSLQKRDGFDLEYSYLLWLRYILDAEIGTRGQTRSFTSYDLLLEKWPSEIEKIARDLNITWPKYNGPQLASIGEMIRPELKRNTFGALIHSTVFAAWFRETFEVLDRWSRDGENLEDYTILDQIRREFNTSSDAFSGAVHAKGKAQSQKLETLKAERDGIQKEAQNVLETLTAQHTALKEQLDISRSTLDQRNAELDDTHQDMQVLKEKLRKEQDRSSQLENELQEATTQLQTLHTDALRHTKVMAHAQKAMLKYQTENEAAHKASVKLNSSVKALNKKVEALQNSSSWRITAPLRRCIRLIKRR